MLLRRNPGIGYRNCRRRLEAHLSACNLQAESKGGLSYADCYSAAMGQLRLAEVITGEPEFPKSREEITLSWVHNPRTE